MFRRTLASKSRRCSRRWPDWRPLELRTGGEGSPRTGEQAFDPEISDAARVVEARGERTSTLLDVIGAGVVTMTLYADGHPARTRAIDLAFEHLRVLQSTDAHPQFRSWIRCRVRNIALRELKEWTGVRDWPTPASSASSSAMT